MCPVGRTRHPLARFLVTLVVLPAAGGALLALGLVAAGINDIHVTDPINLGQQSSLAPIPIPRRACPFLDAVRTTSSAAGKASGALLDEHTSERAKAGYYEE